ncbi:unnamed protein product [Vicia faba]|uniref:Uncharacterized protein n=1 Tax=Vicia faba TaxID=3906 RepID=A0AAV0Z7E6_VICFA|nr:unnamed protein product [Vicia faba]
MKEKSSSRDNSTLDDNDSQSPPSRHELWKRARQKKGGEYTSKSTQEVAQKIDSLVQEAEKGAIVPDGRNDILSLAIGTSEHGGLAKSHQVVQEEGLNHHVSFKAHISSSEFIYGNRE